MVPDQVCRAPIIVVDVSSEEQIKEKKKKKKKRRAVKRERKDPTGQLSQKPIHL